MEEPTTPQKVKPEKDLKSPLHRQLETPVPSSPTAPRTPETQQTRLLSTPRSLRTTRVPLTPGSKLFLPASPLTVQPWTTSRPSSTGTQNIPPMPLPTLSLEKLQIKDLSEAELRSNLEKALDTVEIYEASCKQFRNLANHYQLQSRLQSFETSEITQRHEVESALSKREIERLLADFMGQHEESALDAEAVKKRLRKTRQRLKDLEQLCTSKDQEIIELRAHLKAHKEQMPPLRPMRSPQKINIPPPASHNNNDFSPLEMLATQVLTERMRRGSSSSTISATSDDEMRA